MSSTLTDTDCSFCQMRSGVLMWYKGGCLYVKDYWINSRRRIRVWGLGGGRVPGNFADAHVVYIFSVSKGVLSAGNIVCITRNHD